jgi:hypothetical protein
MFFSYAVGYIVSLIPREPNGPYSQPVKGSQNVEASLDGFATFYAKKTTYFIRGFGLPYIVCAGSEHKIFRLIN